MKEIVFRRFYKYLKVFKKKKLERMPIKKIWDYAINPRKGFVPKRGRYTIVKNREGESIRFFKRLVEEEVYLAIKVTTYVTSILCAEEGWKKEDDAKL